MCSDGANDSIASPVAAEALADDFTQHLARLQQAMQVIAAAQTDAVPDNSVDVLAHTDHFKVQRLAAAVAVISSAPEDFFEEVPEAHTLPSFITPEQRILVEENISLVELVLHRYFTHLPSHVDWQSLVSAGENGLIDAAARFDPNRSLQFATFATARVRGAIIDYLRELDWAPRSIRRYARSFEEAERKLTEQFKRPPTDKEIAEALELPTDKVLEVRNYVLRTKLVSIEENHSLEDDSLHDLGANPQDVVDEKETMFIIREAIRSLPKKEMYVVEQYYLKGLTQEEIGQQLGVTESRVSQIASKAVTRIREIARINGLEV